MCSAIALSCGFVRHGALIDGFPSTAAFLAIAGNERARSLDELLAPHEPRLPALDT
jgi:hypothetical protein